ncbi:MAG: YfhO family protein [Lachnospiraceae bacterium]|nr:YfhO family protein [Lachnospiraceae bacterium]
MKNLKKTGQVIYEYAAKKTFACYTAVFLVIFALCFSCFLHRGTLPIYSIDGLGQYYPSFLYIGRMLRGSFHFYDLSIGMGENVIGTLNYYGLGDPVNLLSVFATDATGPYLFALTYWLRLYLGGACALLYCRHFRLDPLACIMAAVSYAFSGYALYASIMYVPYAAMLYIFPLLLLGCEKVFDGSGKGLLLLLASCCLGLSGFYFTYMCGIFLVVYCVIRLCFRHGRTDRKAIVSKCLQCALLFVLGIALSAPILLPSLMTFLSSERTTASPLSQLLRLSNYIPSLNRNFVSDANVMNAIRNYPVMLLSAALFFLPATGRIRQLRIAVASLFVLLYLPITAIALNGFSNPRDRWVFEAQFVLCIAFAVVLSELRLREMTAKLYAPLLILTALGIVFAFWGRYSGLGENQKTMFVTAVEARDEMTSVISASETVRSDPELFRIAGDLASTRNERPTNNAMIAGYYGLQYWFSLVNGDTQQFVDETTGFRNDWRSFGLNDPEAETAAGVKYYFGKGDDVPEGYRIVETIDTADGTRTVSENPSFRGFAYFTDENGTPVDGLVQSAYDTDRFTFTVQQPPEKSGELVTAVPFAKGWSALINGQSGTLENHGHFLALPADGLGQGDVIELRYISPGFREGLRIAAVSMLLVIVHGIVSGRKKRSER